ncbi:membrane protein insertion efficiency factor YidD [Rhodovulum sulfidophilum]|uniref:membrane protein insertion efficiency factor YidD n=1 Tax=Rhodovulum sulfidophilum TaxID=35806 RepID=UPI00398C730D
MSLRTIDFYQRRISPCKGFICAYRAVHGNIGCSGFVRQRIAETGLLRAMPAIAACFTACR